MALVHVLPAVSTHARVGRHRGAAAGTLQRLRGRLVVLVEVGELNHQVGRHDGQRQVDLHLRLARGQLHLLGLVPAGRPGERERACYILWTFKRRTLTL